MFRNPTEKDEAEKRFQLYLRESGTHSPTNKKTELIEKGNEKGRKKSHDARVPSYS